MNLYNNYMRIGIDISAVPYGTGVSRYTANLVQALIPNLGEDHLYLFGSSLRGYSQLEAFSRFSDYPLIRSLHHLPPSLTSFFFNSLHLPINWFTGPLDVFHAWDWQIPSVSRGALVSTIHDLALFKFPDTAHPAIKAHHQQTLSYLKQHAAQVITVSQATKTDLVDLFQFDPAKITIIPEALPRESQITGSTEAFNCLKSSLGISKPYFLFVGTQEKENKV